MTALDLISDVDLDDIVGDAHYACCDRDEFFCGAPFHEEAVAAEGDEGCVTCAEIFDIGRCVLLRGSHQHCPFTGHVCHGGGRRKPRTKVED